MKILHKITKYHTQILLFILAVSILAFSVSAYIKKYEHIDKELNTYSKEIAVSGKICSYPDADDENISFELLIGKSNLDCLKGEKISVTLTKLPKGCKIPEYEDKVSLKSRVSSKNGSMNPGAFNYDEYLIGMDVVGKVNVKYDDVKIFSSSETSGKKIYRLRNRFIENTKQYFSPQSAGMVAAIVSGDREGISGEDKAALKMSGIYHIVAISGLHLNLFVFMVSFFISKLKMKRFLKALISLISTVLVGGFVLMFTGYGLSVYRALIMMTVFSFSSVVSRQYTPKYSLLISGFLIVTFMPHSLWNAGFLLSFLSTLGVLISIDILRYASNYPKFKKLSANYAIKTITVSVVTMLFTLPVTVTYFGYITVYSWLTNMLVLPVVPWFLGGSSVFAVFSILGLDTLAQLVSYPLTALSHYILYISRFVASLPYSAPEVTAYSICVIISYIFAFVLSVYTAIRKSMKKAFIIILCFGVAFSAFLKYNNTDELKITFLDIGQGECAIIETPSANLMIDCGTDDFSAEYNAGTVADVLRSKGIDRLDLVILSHYHTDHTNMLPFVASYCKIDKLLIPEYNDIRSRETEICKKSILDTSILYHIEVEYIKDKSSIRFNDGTKLSFISPEDDMFYEENDMSSVIKLTYGKNKILFSGDIENDGMKKLEDKNIECLILKVPHHGGYCRHFDGFLSKTKCKYAVISCGEGNSFGHPKKETTDSILKYGSKIYRTDKMGAITFTLNKNGICDIQTMR